jgi:hypothetical protein
LTGNLIIVAPAYILSYLIAVILGVKNGDELADAVATGSDLDSFLNSHTRSKKVQVISAKASSISNSTNNDNNKRDGGTPFAAQNEIPRTPPDNSKQQPQSATNKKGSVAHVVAFEDIES